MKVLPICYFALSLLTGFQSLMAQQEYQVKVKDTDTVYVTARLNLSKPELHLPIMGTDVLPDGPASFIHNLEVRDSSGALLEIKDTKNNGNYFTWKLNPTAIGNIKLKYKVALVHDQFEWPFGVEEIAYRTSEGFMIVGRYLFVLADFEESEPYEVRFLLPDSWMVSSPWPAADQPFVYSGLKAGEVRDNVLFIGSHTEERVTVGSTVLRLVLAPGLQADKQQILEYLQPNMESIEAVFGASPRSSYLVVLQEGPIAGGAFNQSYSMLIEKPVNKGSSALWGHGMIHETFHLWNGRGLIPGEQMEWFREGVTEYLSIWIQAQTGHMEQKVIEKKLENAYRRSFLATVMGQGMSLQEAGNNKNQNRMKIYGMGTFFAFILDIEIRHANNNTYGLNEVIKRMYSDFVPADERYLLKDVIQYSNEVAGKALTPLFDDYVTGVKQINANEHLRKAGLLLSAMYDETYISFLEGASRKQLSIREALFGRSRD